jgi:hypothetical protein
MRRRAPPEGLALQGLNDISLATQPITFGYLRILGLLALLLFFFRNPNRQAARFYRATRRLWLTG